MVVFESDNIASACPEIIDVIAEANVGTARSYGNDEWSSRLKAKLSEVFETEVIVFPAVTGTASNALALAALTPVYGKIYCHALSHVNTDECGAPEFFTGGAKLVPLIGEEGKINATQLAQAIRGIGNLHVPQPATVSIAQSCETGGVYSLAEIAEISEVAHRHGMKAHMDGARFANGLVALNTTPAEMTWKAGIDVLSFGGTKNGCIAAEAIIFFSRELADNFQYLHKRSGQLLSKMRFVSSQLVAYLSNDLWIRNARHANSMAKRLSEGLSRMPGVTLAYPVRANEVFARLPEDLVAHLQRNGYEINAEELDGTAARFVAAWNTEASDVDAFLSTAIQMRGVAHN